MPDLPIACTLSPDGLAARRSWVDALAADALLDRAATASGLRVRLLDTPDVERRVRELVAAESQCCPFLDIELGREDGALVLYVSGPEGAEPVNAMLFAPDGPPAQRAESGASEPRQRAA